MNLLDYTKSKESPEDKALLANSDSSTDYNGEENITVASKEVTITKNKGDLQTNVDYFLGSLVDQDSTIITKDVKLWGTIGDSNQEMLLSNESTLTGRININSKYENLRLDVNVESLNKENNKVVTKQSIALDASSIKTSLPSNIELPKAQNTTELINRLYRRIYNLEQKYNELEALIKA